MKLYIDLEKGTLNTAKLVRKRVMVRGANGKIYYRMQWVDPRTGQPADAHTIQANPVPNDKKEASKKSYDIKTQKGFIDHHVDKNMTREEKYNHLSKHGISWKRNDHEAIDHKNAMMALKDHLYRNPHLVGAEHLPQEGEDPLKTPEGGHSVDDFAAKYKKHPELLYEMLRHLGVIDQDHQDPRTVEGQQHPSKGGNGKGDIMHMKNMMAFKKHLKANPHLIAEMMNHEKFGAPHGAIKGSGDSPKVVEPPKAPAKTPSAEPPQSKAAKGGNTIKGVLNTMSAEEIYGLMRHLGIAEKDPRLDPSIPEKMRPIHHMKNMMALKKAIESDPSILNLNPDTGGLSDEEKERVKSLSGKEKLAEDAKNFLDRASRDLKLRWAGDYADHEHMKNRIKSNTEHIDNMHKIAALKKILMDDPSIMDELSGELEHEELLNMKIGNKDMGKFLRQIAGLTGIGDVVAGFERGKQWEFGVASTAEITEDDEGEPILSIVDAGKDGEEFNEIAFPLKKVKEFLDGLKEGKKVDVQQKEIPLHKKAPTEIWRALNNDFEGNYNDAVGQVLKKELGDVWDAARTNETNDFLKASPLHIEKSTFLKLLKEYGVNTSTDGNQFDYRGDNWKKVVYAHKVDQTKTKNAMDYLEKNPNGSHDTWVLHQSARQWTPDQRTEARKDFIGGNMKIDDFGSSGDHDYENDKKTKLIDHLHKSLEHVPFDLMTDVFAKGCSLNFAKKSYDGSDHIGNFHSGMQGGIWFDHAYYDDDSSLFNGHPMYHRPSMKSYPESIVPKRADGSSYKYGFHPFSDTVAHEFAHAIDNYLSGGGNDYVKWDSTEQGRKYAGKHINVISNSYDAAVNKSNPNKNVGKGPNKNQPYWFHLDEWMSHYEGRIYNNSDLQKNPNGTYRDITYSPNDKGVEHWSENVSRMANAVHMYKQWQEETGNTSVGMDSWASQMHEAFRNNKGYGDEATTNQSNIYGEMLRPYTANGSRGRNDNPQEAYGYLYHIMSKRHPELHGAIKDMLLRPDFVDDDSVAGIIPRAERGDHTRKSLDLIIDLEG